MNLVTTQEVLTADENNNPENGLGNFDNQWKENHRNGNGSYGHGKSCERLLFSIMVIYYDEELETFSYHLYVVFLKCFLFL